MDKSVTTRHGESPPPARRIVAGDAEVVSMKIQRSGGFRLLAWTGTALLLAVLGGAPRDAEARLYKPNEPPYPDGDPTADDQPSPTPKLNRNVSAHMQGSANALVGKAGFSYGRLIWLSYVRTWIRIIVL
jgi:hypothetical protein